MAFRHSQDDGLGVIHYHGTPISPVAELLKMKGRHFCVSFADPRDADRCQQIGQSILFDNGAFSVFTRGHTYDPLKYYAWLEPRLAHPHRAICPDVIDGTEDQQRKLLKDWPFPPGLSLPVWHLGLSLDYLRELADLWPAIAFGSSAKYWKIGSDAWERRIDEAFDTLSRRRRYMPWIHMLRGLAVASGGRWPFASADSINVGRNFKDQSRCPEKMAHDLDGMQPKNTFFVGRSATQPRLIDDPDQP